MNAQVIEAKIGDLDKWTWNGGYSYNDHDVPDSEPIKCLCGNPLIHCFIIVNRKTGNTAIVGSECLRLFKRGGRAQALRMRPSDVTVK